MQRKRFNELERLRKLEILQKLKAERELSQEIVATLRMSSTGGFDAKNSLSRSASRNIVVSFGLSFSFIFFFVSKITSYVIIGKCIV